MKIAISLILSVGLLTVNCPAQESETPTLAEAKAEFEKADAELNETYQKVKESIPKWAFEKLKAEQKGWPEFRDARALSDATFNGGHKYREREKEAPDYWESMTATTETRAAMIKGWLQMKEDAPSVPLSGIWTDGYGGWLEIAVADAVAGEEKATTSTMAFHLEVVRGPTYHLGGIGGLAKLNGDLAFYTDNGIDGDDENPVQKDGETWLLFEKLNDAPQLEIKAENTQHYHGARAYFQGIYTRVGDLDEKDRKAILKGNFFRDNR